MSSDIRSRDPPKLRAAFLSEPPLQTAAGRAPPCARTPSVARMFTAMFSKIIIAKQIKRFRCCEAASQPCNAACFTRQKGVKDPFVSQGSNLSKRSVFVSRNNESYDNKHFNRIRGRSPKKSRAFPGPGFGDLARFLAVQQTSRDQSRPFKEAKVFPSSARRTSSGAGSQKNASSSLRRRNSASTGARPSLSA